MTAKWMKYYTSKKSKTLTKNSKNLSINIAQILSFTKDEIRAIGRFLSPQGEWNGHRGWLMDMFFKRKEMKEMQP